MSVWCSHLHTTDPDRDGKAICTACGAAVQVRLTRTSFAAAADAAYRAGFHDARCVDTPEGWCCAPGCPSAHPRDF